MDCSKRALSIVRKIRTPWQGKRPTPLLQFHGRYEKLRDETTKRQLVLYQQFLSTGGRQYDKPMHRIALLSLLEWELYAKSIARR